MPIPLAPLLLVLGLFLAVPAIAQTAVSTDVAVNPYEGRVNVADQSNASRDAGLREALAQVVTRVSGAGAPATAAGLIARATQYVQTYGFVRDASGGLQLVARFDNRALDQQLRALGLPVWGYAAAPSADLALRIANVRGGVQYARVMAALRAVPGVQAVVVTAAQQDLLDLVIRAEGGEARVLQVLRGTRQFVDLAPVNGVAVLQYLP